MCCLFVGAAVDGGRVVEVQQLESMAGTTGNNGIQGTRIYRTTYLVAATDLMLILKNHSEPSAILRFKVACVRSFGCFLHSKAPALAVLPSMVSKS